MTTTTEAVRVLAPAGAESEWISLAEVARRLFAAPIPAPERKPSESDREFAARQTEHAERMAARALVVHQLEQWAVRVRVLAYPELKALEARHDGAAVDAKAASTTAAKVAAARDQAEAEVEILRAGLAALRHGAGEGERVDAAKADDVARWSMAWYVIHAIVSYNSLREAERAGFFTRAPEPSPGAPTPAAPAQ